MSFNQTSSLLCGFFAVALAARSSCAAAGASTSFSGSAACYRASDICTTHAKLRPHQLQQHHRNHHQQQQLLIGGCRITRFLLPAFAVIPRRCQVATSGRPEAGDNKPVSMTTSVTKRYSVNRINSIDSIFSTNRSPAKIMLSGTPRPSYERSRSNLARRTTNVVMAASGGKNNRGNKAAKKKKRSAGASGGANGGSGGGGGGGGFGAPSVTATATRSPREKASAESLRR